MKKLMFLLLVVTLSAACSDDDGCTPGGSGNMELVSPKLFATLPVDNPMTGALSVYPCQQNSSIYFGNYNSNGELTPIHGFYVTQNGSANGGGPVVRLPIGVYNMVYWALPVATTTQYSGPAVVDPAVTIGSDLSTLYYGLRKRENVADTTYYPTYDYALAVGSVDIGKEDLQAALKRKSAAIDVIVQNKDNTAFAENIDSMWVHLGGIAEKINFYTGEPTNVARTVDFPLISSENNMKRISNTVMVFPSTPSPLFQLFIQLNNGTIKVYKQNLAEALTAGSKLTLTLTLNEIMSEENEVGEFTVNDWTEKTETIDVPPIW